MTTQIDIPKVNVLALSTNLSGTAAVPKVWVGALIDTPPPRPPRRKTSTKAFIGASDQ